MSARRCFTGKIAAGAVSRRAGDQILDMLNGFEAEYQARLGDGAGQRQAALEAAEVAKNLAARRADEARGSLVAQVNTLRAFKTYDQTIATLRNQPGALGFGNQAPPGLGGGQSTLGAAMRSLLARDPWEIGTWQNVHYLARTLRAEAHRQFAEAIEYLRPKTLGFQSEVARELDVLRALYGRTDVDANARAAADAFAKIAEQQADQFRAAGGALAKRERWRLPNPDIDPNKVRAIGAERFKALVRQHVDRAEMMDWATGQPMNDARFEQLLTDATNGFLNGFVEGPPSGAARGRRMLANGRDFPRFFVWKSAESWQAIADAVGTHASVFDTMTGHLAAMAQDTAMMRVLGPNPEATKRFILDLFDREPGRLAQAAASADPAAVKGAVKSNRVMEARVRQARRGFEALWSEITGDNRVPVNMTVAQGLGDVRHILTAAQLGGALVSSITDPGLAAMGARFNGIPAMGVLARGLKMMAEPGSEIFAAQQGLVLDTLAHAAGMTDKVLGEDIRTGKAAKLSNAVIRGQGLRRWTAIWRAAFGLEMMAHAARERGKVFAELAPEFRTALERYGISSAEWEIMRAATPHEPRPNALFLRPVDIAEGGSLAHQAASDKFARLMHTEMDYAVIEGDPLTRSLLIGQSQPGTLGGEARRAVTMYRSFPTTFIAMHFARAAARGWDGSRLGHAALTFAAMTVLGAGAMQTKEILAGRDPLNLNPTQADGLQAWGKAILQGGGLGVFGDVLFVDQTKYGNTWASTVAGPVAGAAETVLGDFVLKNVQLAAKGKETHFLGDAAYAIGRHLPGSSLWYARLAFQRAVLDQLHLMIEPQARERFARIEQRARKEWHQDYWWRIGRTAPERRPDLSTALGREQPTAPAFAGFGR